MNHIAGWKNSNQNLRLRNQEFEYPHYVGDNVHARGIIKPEFNFLESLIDHDIRRFHKNSKNDVIIIYELSQAVFYRHNERNPELADLAASLFLFFSDFAKYLNIEEKQLIPAVRGLIQKTKYSEIRNSDDKTDMRELIRKIRLEHHAAIKKLINFRTLTKDYTAPENASKSYRHFFAKLKKFEHDLAMYIHFENKKFFPLAIELENYLNKM